MKKLASPVLKLFLVSVVRVNACDMCQLKNSARKVYRSLRLGDAALRPIRVAIAVNM